MRKVMIRKLLGYRSIVKLSFQSVVSRLVIEYAPSDNA